MSDTICKLTNKPCGHLNIENCRYCIEYEIYWSKAQRIIRANKTNKNTAR